MCRGIPIREVISTGYTQGTVHVFLSSAGLHCTLFFNHLHLIVLPDHATDFQAGRLTGVGRLGISDDLVDAVHQGDALAGLVDGVFVNARR
ncbi:hypothetical protein PR202_gb09369 [Eleusine coracana subsp. coracana]|uniref:Uncharacterized protein n=1 Tax=Eleusine coracana subsp. coracana TaxID=191504 RepID=A0AAV5EFF9_ELECO|nr:hypothetical protein PR202_gb09369 [Eleusine coracana subsp. coracana]